MIHEHIYTRLNVDSRHVDVPIGPSRRRRCSFRYNLMLVSKPPLAIGARRRRGGSRVSVSGQARDGGTRGVNQKHDKNEKDNKFKNCQ